MGREQHGHRPDATRRHPRSPVAPPATVCRMNQSADERTTAAGRSRSPFIVTGVRRACRVQQWSYAPHIAQLVLYQQRAAPTAADLEVWLGNLRAMGYQAVRTTAIGPATAEVLEANGFAPLQELVLLEHLEPRRVAAAVPTRRLLVGEEHRAVAVDLAAFGEQWALDDVALHDARTATPHHRGRANDAPLLSAYAITGREGRQGFLQRLAVHPDAQRRGLGALLVTDALTWLARWRVERVLVNTPVHNEPALTLYHRFGFRALPDRLSVHERSLQ